MILKITSNQIYPSNFFDNKKINYFRNEFKNSLSAIINTIFSFVNSCYNNNGFNIEC